MFFLGGSCLPAAPPVLDPGDPEFNPTYSAGRRCPQRRSVVTAEKSPPGGRCRGAGRGGGARGPCHGALAPSPPRSKIAGPVCWAGPAAGPRGPGGTCRSAASATALGTWQPGPPPRRHLRSLPPSCWGAGRGGPHRSATMRSRSLCVMRKVGGGGTRHLPPGWQGWPCPAPGSSAHGGSSLGLRTPSPRPGGEARARGSGSPGGTSARGQAAAGTPGAGTSRELRRGPAGPRGGEAVLPVGLGGRAPRGGAGTGHPGTGLG